MDPDFVPQVKCTIFLAQQRFEGIFGFVSVGFSKKYLFVPFRPQYFFFGTKHPILEAFSGQNPLESCKTYCCNNKKRIFFFNNTSTNLIWKSMNDLAAQKNSSIFFAYGQHSALSQVCDSGASILYHESKSIPWVFSIP